ncbi:hypothetical protein HK405_005222, partial [Cladochytrium tenue]
MPNNRKIKVSKISGADRAHPYSRKAGQVRRALHRQDRVAKTRSAKDADRARAAERLLWFKFALPDDLDRADTALVHDLAMQLSRAGLGTGAAAVSASGRYVERNDDEIQRLRDAERPGRPKNGRLVLLEMLRARDLAEYSAGMEMPDLTSAANVQFLRSWDGDHNSLDRLRMAVVRAAERTAVPASVLPVPLLVEAPS